MTGPDPTNHESRLSKVEALLETVATGLAGLERSVQRLADQRQTNWPVLISAVTLGVGILGAAGAAIVRPLMVEGEYTRRDLDRIILRLDRMDAVDNESRTDRARLTEHQTEIETQFREEKSVRDLKIENAELRLRLDLGKP